MIRRVTAEALARWPTSSVLACMLDGDTLHDFIVPEVDLKDSPTTIREAMEEALVLLAAEIDARIPPRTSS